MSFNPLKEIWAAGGAAVGTYIMYSRDLTTVQLAAAAGLDFVLFDLEHRPQDSETVHDLSQVARLAGMAPIVGPREISAQAISHALDLGASGVLVPHVETPEDVELAVNAVRYPPEGRRGRSGTAGHNLYAPSRSIAEETGLYNREVTLLLKVETESAIGRLKELVAPDAVDGVTVGPLDLSLDLGIPGETDHPRVLELKDRVREVCRKQNLQYGEHVSSAEGVPQAIDAGATWVVVGSEMEFLSAAWKSASQARRA